MTKNAEDPFARGADRDLFPEFYAEMDAQAAQVSGGDWGSVKSESICVGPILYSGQAALQQDIENFKLTLETVDVEEAFLPVAAPASAIPDRKNEYYASNEECVFALADAMRTEYKTIVDAGL